MDSAGFVCSSDLIDHLPTMGEALGLIFSPRILINFIIKNLQIKKLCAEIN